MVGQSPPLRAGIRAAGPTFPMTKHVHTPRHYGNLHGQHAAWITVELIGHFPVRFNAYALHQHTPIIGPLLMPAPQDAGQVSQAVHKRSALEQTGIQEAIVTARTGHEPQSTRVLRDVHHKDPPSPQDRGARVPRPHTTHSRPASPDSHIYESTPESV